MKLRQLASGVVVGGLVGCLEPNLDYSQPPDLAQNIDALGDLAGTDLAGVDRGVLFQRSLPTGIHTAGCNGFQNRGLLLAARGDGSFAVAGNFSGSIDLGDGVLTAARRDGGTQSSEDIFLASFGPDGRLKWSRRYGAGSDEMATDLAIDTDGNLALTGCLDSSGGGADLGGGSTQVMGEKDAFVARYDARGQFLWRRTFGSRGVGPNGAWRGEAVVANSNSIVIMGHAEVTSTESSVELGNGPLPLVSTGQAPVFVASYNASDGRYQWAKLCQGLPDHGSIESLNMASANGGDLFLSGSMGGDNQINCGVSSPALPAQPGSSAWVARFTSSGSNQWTISFRSAGTPDGILGVESDVVMTGRASSVTSFGGNAVPENAMYLVRLAGVDGSVRWATAARGRGKRSWLAASGDGGIFQTGEFNGSITFGTDQLDGAGSFLARWDESGKILWAKFFRDAHQPGIATSGADVVVLGGFDFLLRHKPTRN